MPRSDYRFAVGMDGENCASAPAWVHGQIRRLAKRYFSLGETITENEPSVAVCSSIQNLNPPIGSDGLMFGIEHNGATAWRQPVANFNHRTFEMFPAGKRDRSNDRDACGANWLLGPSR
jgi:hypothetical protein